MPSRGSSHGWWWVAKFPKLFDNSGQLVPTFLSKYWREHKNIIAPWQFLFYLVRLCFDSTFNLIFNFLFLCKTLVFIFLQFGRPKYQPQISFRSVSVYIKVFVKVAFLWISVTSKIHYQNRSLFKNTYRTCGVGLQPGTYFNRSFIFGFFWLQFSCKNLHCLIASLKNPCNFW